MHFEITVTKSFSKKLDTPTAHLFDVCFYLFIDDAVLNKSNKVQKSKHFIYKMSIIQTNFVSMKIVLKNYLYF